MALGKKLFQIDWKDFVRGMSTSDDMSDGGFSPSTDAVNPIVTPGVLYSVASPTDKSTNLVGEMIASCEDPATSASRLYVSADSDQDGRFYSADSDGDLTLRGSEDTTGNYAPGKTDMTSYKGEVYVTNDRYVVRWQQPATFNTTFYDFTGTYSAATSVPHPVLVFEDSLYYGNGNVLLRQTSAGGAPATILTLPSSQIITALGTDPGSGRMLIAIVSQLNISGTVNSEAKVLYYDGFSNKVLRSVPVDSMVTAFPYTEGQLYAAYDTKIGLWNGAGITFLRNLDLTFDNAVLPYKHHFASIASTLYVIEKTRILAYGPIRQGGEKVWYPAFKNQINSNNFTNIAYLGSSTGSDQLLSMSFSSAKFYTFNIRSVATTNTQQFYTNEYEFDDEVWVRRVRIIWKNQVSAGVDPGGIVLVDENGDISSISTLDLTNDLSVASAYKDIPVGGGGTGTRVKQLQLRISLSTVNPGIRRIIVYGDPANIT